MNENRQLQMGVAVRGCFGERRHDREAALALFTLGRLSALSLSLTAALTATGAHAGTISLSNVDYANPAAMTVNDQVQITNAGTIVNDGTLGGGVLGAIVATGTIGTLNNNGLISGSNYGILANSTMGTLNNNSSGTISSSYIGIMNFGTISVLNNDGVMASGYADIQNYLVGTIVALNNRGTIGSIYNGTFPDQAERIGTLTNSGLIRSIFNFGNIGALNNDGGIEALTNAVNSTILSVSNHGTINAVINGGTLSSLLNAGGGLITSTGANTAAIRNTGTVTTLTNAGAINGAYGINNDSSAGIISALNNSGTITGSVAAIRNAGAIGELNNMGVISGGNGLAISLGAGSALGSFTNAGAVLGTIANNSGAALTINGGAGALFGTLTGAGGGIGAGDTGFINSNANVVFGSGSQLLNDNISVNGGAGTVSNTGALQINNPIAITGNFTQGSGANLLLGITNPSTGGNIADTGYGRLVVNGNAVLDGSTVTLKPIGYRLAQGQRYVVVAATGTVSAVGVTYSSGDYVITGAIRTDTSNAAYHDLVLTLGSPLAASNATNGNALSSLNGLFGYTGTDSSMLGVFNPAVALNTPQSANRAGAQLSPAAVRDAVFRTSVSASGAVQDAIGERIDGQRMAQLASGGVSTGESSLDPTLWGHLFGGKVNQGERDGVSGYHANTTGFLLGADLQALAGWRAGGLFSYARTNIGNDGDNSGSSASINAYGLTAYAGYDGKPWYLNVTAGAARQIYDTTRAISYTGFGGVAQASFQGELYSASVQAGYPLALGDATLTPMLGLRYGNLRQDGYTETGGNGAALTVASGSGSSLKSEVAAKYERSLQTSSGELKPFTQLGWLHEFRGALRTGAGFAGDTTGTTAFTAPSASPLRNSVALSLGATLLRGRNLSVQARYTIQAGRAYTAQTGEATLRWQY